MSQRSPSLTLSFLTLPTSAPSTVNVSFLARSKVLPALSIEMASVSPTARRGGEPSQCPHMDLLAVDQSVLVHAPVGCMDATRESHGMGTARTAKAAAIAARTFLAVEHDEDVRVGAGIVHVGGEHVDSVLNHPGSLGSAWQRGYQAQLSTEPPMVHTDGH